MSLKKITVVETAYLPGNDVVIWDVETENKEPHKLFWERKFFHTSFSGIKHELSPKMVMYFNDIMLGKQMMLDIGGAGPVPIENEPNKT